MRLITHQYIFFLSKLRGGSYDMVPLVARKIGKFHHDMNYVTDINFVFFECNLTYADCPASSLVIYWYLVDYLLTSDQSMILYMDRQDMVSLITCRCCKEEEDDYESSLTSDDLPEAEVEAAPFRTYHAETALTSWVTLWKTFQGWWKTLAWSHDQIFVWANGITFLLVQFANENLH